MRKSRFTLLLFSLFLGLLLLPGLFLYQVSTVHSQEADDLPGESEDGSIIEQKKAVGPEQKDNNADTIQHLKTNNGPIANAPLFVGVDDITVPAYQIDITANAVYSAFVGVEVWGAAFDYENDRVFFSDGSDLYEWSVGSTPSFLGPVTVVGSNVSVEGLA